MFEVLRWFLIMLYYLQTDNKTFPKHVLQQNNTSSDIAKMILDDLFQNGWNCTQNFLGGFSVVFRKLQSSL